MVHPSLRDEREAKVLGQVLVWYQVVFPGNLSAVCHKTDNTAAPRFAP